MRPKSTSHGRKFKYLGSFSSSLSSLDELASPMLKVMDQIEEDQQLTGKKFSLAAMFSSRGSLPFLHALKYLTGEGGIKSDIDLRIVPHVFSLENLLEIVSDFDKLTDYNSYKPILDVFYGDIAEGLGKKVDRVCAGTNAVVSDWDEVNTGRNLLERIKINNQMGLDPLTAFYIISFIGSNAKNIDSNKSKLFRKFMKASPETYRYLDVKATDPISWSDDEEFFRRASLVYPGIAAPDAKFVRNIIPKQLLPLFYNRFFRNHCDFLANEIGEETSSVGSDGIMYKIFNPRKKTITQVSEPSSIMLCSYNAYVKTLGEFGNLNDGFKSHMDPFSGTLGVDTKNGIIYWQKTNGIDVPVLRRRHPSIPDHFEPYRNPFVLLYDQNSAQYELLKTMMSGYFKHVRSDQTRS
jgi:hypothetical protein